MRDGIRLISQGAVGRKRLRQDASETSSTILVTCADSYEIRREARRGWVCCAGFANAPIPYRTRPQISQHHVRSLTRKKLNRPAVGSLRVGPVQKLMALPTKRD